VNRRSGRDREELDWFMEVQRWSSTYRRRELEEWLYLTKTEKDRRRRRQQGPALAPVAGFLLGRCFRWWWCSGSCCRFCSWGSRSWCWNLLRFVPRWVIYSLAFSLSSFVFFFYLLSLGPVIYFSYFLYTLRKEHIHFLIILFQKIIVFPEG